MNEYRVIKKEPKRSNGAIAVTIVKNEKVDFWVDIIELSEGVSNHKYAFLESRTYNLDELIPNEDRDMVLELIEKYTGNPTKIELQKELVRVRKELQEKRAMCDQLSRRLEISEEKATNYKIEKERLENDLKGNAELETMAFRAQEEKNRIEKDYYILKENSDKLLSKNQELEKKTQEMFSLIEDYNQKFEDHLKYRHEVENLILEKDEQIKKEKEKLELYMNGINKIIMSLGTNN